MKSAGLMFFTDIHWTLIGLIIFFVSFFVLITLHMRTYRRETLSQVERLPFEGDHHDIG